MAHDFLYLVCLFDGRHTHTLIIMSCKKNYKNMDSGCKVSHTHRQQNIKLLVVIMILDSFLYFRMLRQYAFFVFTSI